VPRSRAGLLRRFPPLLAVLAALLIAVFVLPSSLSLHQANPTETEQFAPVPPSLHQAAQQVGNLSSLSLGLSPSLSNDGAGGNGPGGTGGSGTALAATPPTPPTPGGSGAEPDEYPCVGDRQTADPLSPPCVAYYNGNNGGSTYQGVTAKQVTVLIYVDPDDTATGTDDGEENETIYSGQYFDLSSQTAASPRTRDYARWMQYFNYHYATYNRHVNFWLYFSTCESGCSSGSPTAQTRESDAASNFAKLHPFAVITSSAQEFVGSYESYLAAKGVLVFGSQYMNDNSFYESYPAHIWDYLPTVQRQAEAFSSYVCDKVVHQPVVDSGNPGMQGKPRVLGLLTTTDQDFPEVIEYGALIKSEIQACGGVFRATGTFPVSNDAVPTTASPYAAQNMSTFLEDGVTTIIWAGGYENTQSTVAQSLDYFPEWIVAGDGENDRDSTASLEDPGEWQHAWMVTYETAYPAPDHQICYQAIRSVAPSIGGDADWACSTDAQYQDLRQLFTGIQVAGPELNPASIDEGFHAIPPIASTNPQVPACYYLVDDYTCTKDSVVEHWDPNVYATVDGSGVKGCYLMLSDGQRTIDGDAWPSGNIDAQYRPGDICNNYA